MHPTRPGPLLLLCLAPAALLLACGTLKSHSRSPLPPAPSATPTASAPPTSVVTTASKKATLKLNTAWARCHRTFAVGSSDVRGEVARLAAGCAEATRMTRVGDVFTGQQGAAEKPQLFRWKARAGHCYRAYGAGVPAIKNLDLLLEDGAGAVLGQDDSNDGAPVVLDGGEVCFTEDDDAAIVVSVGDGAGEYAVEVWGD